MKLYYSGYVIMVECCTNFYVDDDSVEHYQASIIGRDRDNIELQVPACSHVMLHGNSAFQQAVLKGYLPGYVHQGVVDGRYELTKSSSQNGSQWKHVVLKFQKGHCLSGMDVDGYAGSTREMHPRFFHAGSTSFIYWVVVCAEIVPNQVENEGTISKGAALLKAMAKDEDAKKKRPHEKMIEKAYEAVRELADAVKNNKRQKVDGIFKR